MNSPPHDILASPLYCEVEAVGTADPAPGQAALEKGDWLGGSETAQSSCSTQGSGLHPAGGSLCVPEWRSREGDGSLLKPWVFLTDTVAFNILVFHLIPSALPAMGTAVPGRWGSHLCSRF